MERGEGNWTVDRYSTAHEGTATARYLRISDPRPHRHDNDNINENKNENDRKE